MGRERTENLSRFHADNSKLQTPQPLFGGYNPCTVPGISIRKADLLERLRSGELELPAHLTTFLEKGSALGEWKTEFMGRAVSEFDGGDCITLAFSAGGAGYGDPLERDPQLVANDVRRGFVSPESARQVYHVVWDPDRDDLDEDLTSELRANERAARLQRGKSLNDFLREWKGKQPCADFH